MANKRAPKGKNLSLEQIEDIIDLIPENFHVGVRNGSLMVRPPEMWWNPEKPVIIDAHDNHIKYGRYATANDPAIVSKQTAYKRKRGYKEMQQVYIGSEPGEHEKQIISLKEIIDSLWDAANGSPQYIECPHPELHQGRDIVSLRHVVAFKKDPNALFKLYENLVGKATETTDINVNQNTLVKLLTDRTPVNELTVIELPPDQIYERKKLIEEAAKEGSEEE